MSEMDSNSVRNLERDGFLLIPCTNEVLENIRAIFEYGRAFFGRPIIEKSQCSIAELLEGYRGFGQEYSVSPDRPDLAEAFSVATRHAEESYQRIPSYGLDLYLAMQQLIPRLNVMVNALIEDLATHYSSASDNRAFLLDRSSHLHLAYYRPTSQSREILQDKHEDAVFATFTTATAPGLQILTRNAVFQPVATARDSLLMMPGSIMSMMSGGGIAPMYHRVVKHADVRERLSLMYFVNIGVPDGQTIRPWVENELNKMVDLGELIDTGPAQFGLRRFSERQPKDSTTV